jgi:type IX secretion system PorP/SprF family membrane protein
MKKNLLLSLIASILFIVSNNLVSQDIHFSQYNETPQLINPASTGLYNGYVRAIINYKNQWMAMGKAYNTSAASLDLPLFDKKPNKSYLGFGFNFFSDKAGDSKFGLTQVNLCLSAILPLTRTSKLSFGLTGGGAQHKANLESVSWGNQFNGTTFDTQNIPSGEALAVNSFMYADLGAGINYEYFSGKESMERDEQKRLSIGFACYHINQPTQTYFTINEKLYAKFVGNMAGNFDLSGSRFSLLPTLACFFQGKSREYDAGCAINFRIRNGTKVTGFYSESGLAIGINYRFKDSFMPTIAYHIGNVAIGFAYDYSTSDYAQANKHFGSLEVYLRYNIIKGAAWDKL